MEAIPSVTAHSASTTIGTGGAGTGGAEFDFEAFHRTLKYQRLAPPEVLRADLRRISELDSESERRQMRYGVHIAVSVFALIASIPGTLFSFVAMGPWAGIPVGAAGLFALISAIYNGRLWAIARKTNVENRRREIPNELLRYLPADMPAEAQLDLSIDFNPHTLPAYLRDTKSSGRTSSAAVKNYELPWLTLKGSFVDGSRFRLAATLSVKRKEKRKRKGIKVRETFTEDVELVVQVKPRRYQRLDRALNPIRALPNRSAYPQIVARVSGDRIHLAGSASTRFSGSGFATEPPLGSHRSMLHLFLACYHGMSACAGEG